MAERVLTTFLLIYFCNDVEDLHYVEQLLATYPNVYTDTSARLPEIGRHPAEQVRVLFIRFQDRILFGTDLALSSQYMQLGSANFAELRSALVGSDGVADVTGGMLHKVERSLELGLRTEILNGLTPGALQRPLLGELVPGTVVDGA